MKPPTGRGRTGLLAVVVLVVLAHGLALERLGGAWSAGPDTEAPAPGQARLVQLVPAPPAAQPAPPAPPPRPAPPPAPRPATPRPAAAPAPTATPPVAPPATAQAPSPDPVDAAVPPLPEPAAPTADPVATTEPAPANDSAPAPVALPPDADLAYQVQGQARGLRYTASGELRWRQSGDRYELSMRLSAFLVGSRSQSSTGQTGAAGLMPERFSDRTRSERAAHFDRSAGLIRFSNNAPDAPLLPGGQDRLSVFIQLAGLLQAGAFPAGATIELPVAGVGGSATWRFAVGDLEPLALPAGTLLARKLVREPADTHDSRVEVWLAPELGHLPVRLRITQPQGDMADQQLSQRP